MSKKSLVDHRLESMRVSSKKIQKDQISECASQDSNDENLSDEDDRKSSISHAHSGNRIGRIINQMSTKLPFSGGGAAASTAAAKH